MVIWNHCGALPVKMILMDAGQMIGCPRDAAHLMCGGQIHSDAGGQIRNLMCGGQIHSDAGGQIRNPCCSRFRGRRGRCCCLWMPGRACRY